MASIREPAIPQRIRLVLLVLEVAILCSASWVVFGRPFPPNGNQGFWFYTGLLGLIFGSRLDTPFFAKPADVVLFAAPAAIALALGNDWPAWDSGRRVAFVTALTFCIVTGFLGVAAILTKDGVQDSTRRISNAARVLAETLGAPRTIYTVVMIFAIYAFHADSPKAIGVIALAWMLTAALGPLEAVVRVTNRLRGIFAAGPDPDQAGTMVAFQTPGLILIRQESSVDVRPDDLLAMKDPTGALRLAQVVDQVGHDEGLLLRTLEIRDLSTPESVRKMMSQTPPGACCRIREDEPGLDYTALFEHRVSLVGLVAPDTSVERLFFDVVRDEPLEEGRLVEARIGGKVVTYQLVNGLTREEIVRQKNTFGFVRAQAQKIGEWDGTSQRFRVAPWLPQPNAPVLLKASADFQPRPEAIGHFPGTDYPVTLRVENGAAVGLSALVTHNTAILGILGIGKSCLALELVERMMATGIKVLCLDLTNQYATELAPYYDAATHGPRIQELQTLGATGKTNVKKNVEEGGSRIAFATAVKAYLETFVASQDPRRLLVLNPAQFQVWRQDSKPFQDAASMASLTPPEITQIISDAVLQVVSALGMTDEARVCIVYEEAHSLVPEWNSAVAEGDRSAANGTARAVLQGRKYGLGCLLITQRTANVTKTILNQCNTVFAMRTFDDTGKEFLANYLGRTYAEVLPSLPERRAVFFGRASQCQNPVLIRANDRNAFLQAFRAAHPAPGQYPATPDAP